MANRLRCLAFLVYAALCLVTFPGVALSAAVTLRQMGSDELNQDTSLEAAMGELLTIEVVLDTDGLSFEGYSYGIDFGPAAVHSIAVDHAELPPLVPDLLGSPIIDESMGTIRFITAASLSGGLASGVYVIDFVSFFLDEIAPEGELVTVEFGPGDTFGLGGGNVIPDTFSALIVPEPRSHALVGFALAALLALMYLRSRRPGLRRQSQDGRLKCSDSEVETDGPRF